MELGLDFALASPEKNPGPLPSNHPMVAKLRDALEQGRSREGESSETAGYRQAEAIMHLCHESQTVDD
jgi:5-methyltetrahydrofolate--homocysteine methyltransferase